MKKIDCVQVDKTLVEIWSDIESAPGYCEEHYRLVDSETQQKIGKVWKVKPPYRQSDAYRCSWYGNRVGFANRDDAIESQTRCWRYQHVN